MKRFILIVICFILASSAMAQGGRTIKGVVFNPDNTPIANVTVFAGNVSTTTDSNGKFTIVVSSHIRELTARAEGYFPETVEIEGSYILFKLQVDKDYIAKKAAAEKQAQLEAQRRAAAEERARIEAQKRAMAEEQARIEAQKRAMAEEQARIEAQKRAVAEEQARIEAEAKAAEAKAKAEEQARIDAEAKVAEAKAKAEEQARIDAEAKAAEAKAKAEEQARFEAQKRAEATAKAQEQARIEAQRRAEAAKAEEPRKVHAETVKGFTSLVDASFRLGFNYPYPSFGVSYIAGYNINKYLLVGAGVGAKVNFKGGASARSADYTGYGKFLNPCKISVPAFAYFRANITDGNCSPFVALSAGGDFSTRQRLYLDLCWVKYRTIGAFVNPQVGVNFRISEDFSTFVAVGFQCFTAPSCFNYTGYNAMLRPAVGYGFDIHVGLTF
jgi:hypothetical protein